DKISQYTKKLDDSLLEVPELALNAVQSAIKNVTLGLFSYICFILGDKENGEMADLVELQSAINETQSYIDKINLESGDGVNWERLVNMIHTLDHLQRLHERCEEEGDRVVKARETDELTAESSLLIKSIVQIIQSIKKNNWMGASWRAKDTSSKIHRQVKPFREDIMSKVARGEYDVSLGTSNLEAIRWLRRVSKHITRITKHFEQAVLASGKPAKQSSIKTSI
ncbi:MAG: Na/Pi cotransporter family protein, partial [Thermodesulfobacteriota bacterium]